MIETGVLFGDIHSFYDLDLILAKVNIPAATPKESYVDVPGANGSIDMTEAFGEVKYNDRNNASFTFYMNPAKGLSAAAWEEKKTEVCNKLNGLRCNIVVEKDPDYYWQGRCKVTEQTANKKLYKITVGARLAPYKAKKDLTRITVSLTANNPEVTLKNSRKTVCPVLIATGNAVLTVDGAEYAISTGSHKILDFQLKEGKTTVSVKGTGTITFEYQECEL